MVLRERHAAVLRLFAAALICALVGLGLGEGLASAANGAATPASGAPTPSAIPSASPAQSLRTWTALVGNYPRVGANGAVLLTQEPDGSGSFQLRLKALLRGSTYPLTVFLGRWMAPGTSWSARGDACTDLKLQSSFTLPAALSTSSGTIVRTIRFSSSQMATLNRTARRLAVAVGAGHLARCGSLLLHLPTPQPAGSVTPSPSPTVPPCSPWPDGIQEIAAGLSTPPGLCLEVYTDPASAPAFVTEVGGIYFPDPPTASYLVGSRVPLGTEFHVLAHELCHAHQDQVARQAGWAPYYYGWFATGPGGTYVQATGWQNWVDHWVATIPAPWGIQYTSPLEENADLCAFWFDPSKGPDWVRRAAPDQYAWAERWLPQPDFGASALPSPSTP